MDDLLHEQVVHAGAGQFGLLEGEPQVAQLGVARARVASLHLIQQGEDDRLEAATVGAASAAARSALAGVVIYICNTAAVAVVASGVSVAAVVMTVVGFAVSPLQAALFLLGQSSMVR